MLTSLNGMDLFIIVNIITPRDHISEIFGLYGMHFKTSGGLYDIVPQHVSLWIICRFLSIVNLKFLGLFYFTEWIRCNVFSYLENPKSDNLTFKFKVTKTFSHLRSRWAMFKECKYCIAKDICFVHIRDWFSLTAPFAKMKSKRSPFSANLKFMFYSKMQNVFFSQEHLLRIYSVSGVEWD